MVTRRILVALSVCSALLLGMGPAFARTTAEPLHVFAASSLTEASNEAGDAYAARGRPRPVFNFAASSVLAHQIEQGAQADIFVSADEEWMDYLQTRNLIERTSRVSFLTNQLVLIAPTDRPFHIAIRPGFHLQRALNGGRLAMADPDSVPAGRYGQAALESLGVWSSVASSVVRGENVRAALRFVEVGEAAAGIVYATDAQASGSRVVVVGTFPAGSHPAITYPMAITFGRSSAASLDFERFLQSPEADAIFRRHGFGVG